NDGDRTDVSGHLWRQPDDRGGGSLDADGLSRAGVDGGPRATAVAFNNCGNHSVTLQPSRHTCYATVSVFIPPVSICDRGCRRSVNSARAPSTKSCKKPLYCRLNPRFTVLNS